MINKYEVITVGYDNNNHDSILFYSLVLSIGLLWVLISFFLDIKAKGFPKPTAYLNSLYNPFVDFLLIFSFASLVLLFYAIMGVYFYSPILCQDVENHGQNGVYELQYQANPTFPSPEDHPRYQGTFPGNKIPKSLWPLFGIETRGETLPYSKAMVIKEVVNHKYTTMTELRILLKREEILSLANEYDEIDAKVLCNIFKFYGFQPENKSLSEYAMKLLKESKYDLFLSPEEKQILLKQKSLYKNFINSTK